MMLVRYGLDQAVAAGDLAAAQLGANGWCLVRHPNSASIQLFFDENWPSPLLSLPGATTDYLESSGQRIEQVRVPFGSYELVSARLLPKDRTDEG